MDPQRVWPEWGPAAERAVLEVLRSHVYVKGPHVAAFEEEFAAYLGVRHAVAVDSCTDALFLVLRAVLQRRPPEAREVVLPPFTFVATAGAVVNAGGVPVFADVDPQTWNLDPGAVAACLSERTAAVIPVHIFGAPADLAGLREVLAPYRSNGDPLGRGEVFLLEDAAQAVHAAVDGRRVGGLADAGTFSFYPSKNLAAAGDGGVVSTDDEALAAQVRALRDHGQTRKLYDHAEVGINSRMDELQAALLRVKLPLIGQWTEQRRRVAARYDEAFADLPLARQRVLPGHESAWHLYTVRVPGRDDLRARLQAADIGCGVYYPQPLHRQTCFAGGLPAECPVSDRLAREVLSLPCFPGLTSAEQERVVTVVRAALEA
jgi:dTDP-4-amino-4,6-dideoxygalactose transaminase